MESANIHEAKSGLSKLIETAMNGEDVILARQVGRWLCLIITVILLTG